MEPGCSSLQKLTAAAMSVQRQGSAHSCCPLAGGQEHTI